MGTTGFGYVDTTWIGQDCGNTFGCMTTNIANFGDQYLWGFLANLQSFVYYDAISDKVLSWSVGLMFLFLFLSFVVGFIFMIRK